MNNSHRLIFCCICLSLTLNSCIRAVELDLPEIPRQLVLMGILSSDSPVSIYLSYTKAIEDTSSQVAWIQDAEVQLKENGQLMGELIYRGEGNYVSSLVPKPGRTYQLEVEISGENLLKAETIIPEVVSLDSAIYTFSSRTNLEGIPLKDYVGYLTDPKEMNNYYEMYFYKYNSRNFQKNYIDGVNSSIVEPAILAEGNPENSFGFSGFSFTDATFEGETYGLELSFTTSDDPNGYIPNPEKRPFLELHHLDTHLYLYRKSLKRHLANQASGIVFAPGDFDLVSIMLLGEPVELYSNVENGLGIFASYNSSERACRFVR